MQSEESDGITQQDSSKSEEKATLTSHCLKCGETLTNDQVHCEPCANHQTPLKHAKLLVLLLISISFVIGFILLITA